MFIDIIFLDSCPEFILTSENTELSGKIIEGFIIRDQIYINIHTIVCRRCRRTERWYKCRCCCGYIFAIFYTDKRQVCRSFGTNILPRNSIHKIFHRESVFNRKWHLNARVHSNLRPNPINGRLYQAGRIAEYEFVAKTGFHFNSIFTYYSIIPPRLRVKSLTHIYIGNLLISILGSKPQFISIWKTVKIQPRSMNSQRRYNCHFNSPPSSSSSPSPIILQHIDQSNKF